MTATGQSVRRMTLSLLILLLAGLFTQVGELPRLPYPDPCGAFTLGRSVLGGCDGLGGPAGEEHPDAARSDGVGEHLVSLEADAASLCFPQ
jgi:hypothetical protein